MAMTLYGTFKDYLKAQTAAEELAAAGIDHSRISVVCKRHIDGGRYAPTEEELNYSRPTMFDQTPGALSFGHDPLDNRQRTGPDAKIVRPMDVDTPINPAQDDYPRLYTNDVTAFSSRPPDAKRDYNTGLENDDYNKSYTTNVEDEMIVEQDRDRRRADTHPEGTPPAGRPHNFHVHAGYNGLGALAALLKHWGFADGDADSIEKSIGDDGAIIAVKMPDESDRPTVERVLSNQGAMQVNSHPAYLA